MKKSLLTLITTAALFSPALSVAATTECVPSKTPEAAKADFDSGMASANATLLQAYTQALKINEDANRISLEEHSARMKDIENCYEQEIKTIKLNLQLGWREEMDAATDRHNEAQKNSLAQYNAEVEAHRHQYGQAVELAKSNYNLSAQKAAEEYNKAVCAQ